MSDAVRMSFVCLGNICRSPTAEGVARHLIELRGLDGRVQVESAGTAAYHLGEAPDRRSTAAAARRGIALDGAARRFDPADLRRLDMVIAMDRANLRELRRLQGMDRPDAPSLRLLREWDPQAATAGGADLDVPDPYYGGPNGFEDVLDIVQRCVAALLDDVVGSPA